MIADGPTQTFWRAAPDPTTQPDVLRVFEYDPDLLASIDAETAAMLRRRVLVRRLEVPCGSWSSPSSNGIADPLGLLVVDGLVCRSICVHGRHCPELLGTGDLLRPWESDGLDMVEGSDAWRVLQPMTIAVLDERFVALLRRWPSIMVTLLARSTQRPRALAFQLAIAQIRQAETRLLTLFWHLAERWGRVTAQGVVLPLPLTHELLGQLACLHRPTTSTALQRLVRSGELARRADRGWVLLGQPPVRHAERNAQPRLAA